LRVLQIASIFPVEDAPRENPYVRQFISRYLKQHDAEIEVVKPVAYLPNTLTAVSLKKEYWQQKRRLSRTKDYTFNQVKITVWPYMSVGSVSELHVFFSSFTLWRNRKKIKQEDVSSYDLIHAHFLFPDGMIAYQLNKKYGIPYVLTLQQELRFLENKLSLKWVKKIINKASAVTTLSPQMEEGLKEKGIEDVQLVPLGIEAYFFKDGCHSERSEESPLKSGGDSCPTGRRASLSLRMTTRERTDAQDDKERKLKLLSVCNLLPIKNLETVIGAISSMPEKEQIDYTIYGTGPLEQQLKELASELQLDWVVHFKGAIENKELPAVMQEYDAFIQPSFKETLGLSYFEALACGLPVILTENTGAYEMIKDKDVYYVVDPHDAESVASCLKGILEDKETLARKAALSPDVAKIASWEGFVKFFHGKYEEVVKNISP